jgi:hypothetical protein
MQDSKKPRQDGGRGFGLRAEAHSKRGRGWPRRHGQRGAQHRGRPGWLGRNPGTITAMTAISRMATNTSTLSADSQLHAPAERAQVS